jgi:hypothetical protein
MILDYHLLVILRADVPHEVVGFSAATSTSSRISGPEVINFSHWLGVADQQRNHRRQGHADPTPHDRAAP